MLKNTIGPKGLLALSLVVILGSVAIGVSTVSADTTTGKTGFMTGFASAIAQKFNLNEADVQAVINEQVQKNHTERETQMKQVFAERLAKAVTNGKLTQAQADLITTKHAEVKAKLEAIRPTFGVSPTEADKEKVKEIMNEVKTWAEANGIPKEFGMSGGHKGMGMKMKMK